MARTAVLNPGSDNERGLDMLNASEKDMAVTKPAKGKVGFALGGLGGFNAYGVGFL
jgi:hypothetical protein